VSEQAAVAALKKLAGEAGDVGARGKVVRWLLGQPGISDRVDETDLARVVEETAARSSSESALGDLANLRTALESSQGTTLVALFRGPEAQEVWEFGPVRFGPPGLLIDEHLRTTSGSWGAPRARAAFAIRVEDFAIGTRGSRRALEWLRAALGALYLAGRASGDGADTRLGPVPADELAPSVFVGPVGSMSGLVEMMRLPVTVPLDVDALLESSEAAALVHDCLRAERTDLVEQRLRQAAPWVQSSFDALAFPEAVLGLGVALESLIGSESTADVSRTIGMRAAFLLREGDTAAERALSGSDWRTKAANLYKARSKVAHGRYEGTLGQDKERELRSDFEDFLCRVAIAFRDRGRTCGWLTDKDLRAWQEQLELA
jgi:hypothetical protein